MLPLNPEKYRKCRMCLVGLKLDDISLFDNDYRWLNRFQKVFNCKFVHNFMHAEKKQFACLCETCCTRIEGYLQVGKVARKGMRNFRENKKYFENKCLMCLEPFNNTDEQVISIFKDKDFKLAKVYGKCLGIKEVHLLRDRDVKSSDKLCELCHYKLEEIDTMRTFVNTLDKEYFGNPFNSR